MDTVGEREEAKERGRERRVQKQHTKQCHRQSEQWLASFLNLIREGEHWQGGAWLTDSCPNAFHWLGESLCRFSLSSSSLYICSGTQRRTHTPLPKALSPKRADGGYLPLAHLCLRQHRHTASNDTKTLCNYPKLFLKLVLPLTNYIAANTGAGHLPRIWFPRLPAAILSCQPL